MYDSTVDTLNHSRRVDELLLQIIAELQKRVTKHDLSKLEDPEKIIFDEYSNKLKHSTYGSDEYKEYLKEMKVALDHHYKNNRHHPEHFELGISGMTLVDVIEMLADWKAAGERHDNGDLMNSLLIQKERFKISYQLMDILANTSAEMNWL